MNRFRQELVFLVGLISLVVVALVYVLVLNGGPIASNKTLYSYSIQDIGSISIFPIVLFFADEATALFTISWMFIITGIILYGYKSGKLNNIQLPRFALIVSGAVSYLLIISLLQYNIEGFPFDFIENCSEQNLNKTYFDPNNMNNWIRESYKCLLVLHDVPFLINMSIFIAIITVWFLISRRLFPHTDF